MPGGRVSAAGHQQAGAWPGTLAENELAELDRHEDARVVTLHEQRHVILRAGNQLAKLLHAVDLVTIRRQHDVAGAESCILGRALDILDQETALDSDLAA